LNLRPSGYEPDPGHPEGDSQGTVVGDISHLIRQNDAPLQARLPRVDDTPAADFGISLGLPMPSAARRGRRRRVHAEPHLRLSVHGSCPRWASRAGQSDKRMRTVGRRRSRCSARCSPRCSLTWGAPVNTLRRHLRRSLALQLLTMRRLVVNTLRTRTPPVQRQTGGVRVRRVGLVGEGWRERGFKWVDGRGLGSR